MLAVAQLPFFPASSSRGLSSGSIALQCSPCLPSKLSPRCEEQPHTQRGCLGEKPLTSPDLACIFYPQKTGDRSANPRYPRAPVNPTPWGGEGAWHT